MNIVIRALASIALVLLFAATGSTQTVLSAIDLNSLIPGAVSSRVVSVSAAYGLTDYAAGTWEDSAGVKHVFVWTSTRGVTVFPVEEPGLTVVSVAQINQNGTVLGTASDGVEYLPFTWSGLAPQRPKYYSSPGLGYAINRNGSAVGISDEASVGTPFDMIDFDPANFSHSTSDLATIPYLMESGQQFRLANAPTLSPQFALSINDAGQVVGFGRSHGVDTPFIWTQAGQPTMAGITVNMGLPDGATAARALRISDSGRVFGLARHTGSDLAFTWTAGDGYTLLNTRGAPRGHSASGLAVFSRFDTGLAGLARASLYVPGTGLVSIDSELEPRGVNNHGIVVGSIDSGAGNQAAYWANGTTAVFSGAGASGKVLAINEEDLAGGWVSINGHEHAYLWKLSLAPPVIPEPPVITLAIPDWVTALSSAGSPVPFTLTSNAGTPSCTANGNAFASGGTLAPGTHSIVCTITDPISHLTTTETRSIQVLAPGMGGSGATGATGATGAAGAVGPAGPQGPIGPQGPMGPQGPAGLTGAIGPQGEIGPQGSAGLPGAIGPQGEAGPQGPAGLPGAVGPQGEIGPQGITGLPGVAGPQGPAGPSGATGPVGAPGPIGVAGPAGAAGATGAKGATGATGPAGPIGPAGPQGVKGNTGATGAMGPQGPRGERGEQGEGIFPGSLLVLPSGSPRPHHYRFVGTFWLERDKKRDELKVDVYSGASL